jgi:hypothetical protein
MVLMGSLTLPQMNAHLLVIIATALAMVVAVARVTALATANGTTLVMSGNVDAPEAEAA